MMTLTRYRKSGTPVAVLVCITYFYASLRATPVQAEETEPNAAQEATNSGATYDQGSRAALAKQLAPPAEPAVAGAAARPTPPKAPDTTEVVQSALEAGAGGGVSGSSSALPGAAGSQLGMGESFSMQLSTGAVSYSVPIPLPSARGRAQPNVTLSYGSGAGIGIAGMGWSAGAPSVERQTDRGVPKYDDRVAWHPNQDRFSFAGSELVPICTVSGSTCAGALAGEVMPSWSSGWQYFRPRLESSYVRYFWSPDHRTWRAQGKEGTTLELGVPTDGTNYEGALERNPDAPAQIFRWHLARQFDTQVGAGGQPVNTVIYRYATNSNIVYLTDIVDTSPAAAPTTTDLSQYAHHVVFTYATRPDPAVSFRAGYQATLAWRLSDIDVTSKPSAGGTTLPRELVRRHHLIYDSTMHRSLLTSIATEGRCSAVVKENGSQRLPVTACPQYPTLKFDYQRVTGTVAAVSDSAGLKFEPIDGTVRSLAQSPPLSLDAPDTGLMDVNGDGLPDLVATSPGSFKGKHGLFLNGSGTTGALGFGAPLSMNVTTTGDVPDPGVLSLHSPMVAALDFDADGLVDLVHMPNANRYSVFSAAPDGSGGLQWLGREITTATQQSQKINFTQEAKNIRVLDVNGDGLVDVVYSSPTELQTFFSLSRYVAADGQFGTASWATATTANVSNDPVVFCPPYSGKPIRLSDPDVQLADMNADGLVDIVRVRDGEVLYWPGRGNGFWGTGALGGCSNGSSFAVDRHIAMKTSPRFGTYDAGSLQLADVNGDGLSDMLVVRSQGVEVYTNDNGLGWTAASRIDGTPFRPAVRSHVRLTDIDGSGTADILWGLGGEYKYVDLTGGTVPNLLTKVSNGTGQTLDFEYTTSTNQMLAAAAAGKPWATVTPTVVPVLARSTVRDHLELVGRPAGVYSREYTYRDPVFEGRQREFRGFSDAVVKVVGDANTPTVYEHSVFQLGECSLQFVGTASDVCTPKNRWQDNWREPLKGLPVINETYDANGVYLATEHVTYELRQLYLGQDGRRVTAVNPIRSDVFAYDTAPFDGVASTMALDEVVVTIPGLEHTETRSVVVRATAGTARTRTATVIDNFGNTTDGTRYGCVSGCPNGTDEAVTAHSDFTRPAGDASGWLWRETRSYVTGSINTARRHETVNTFDAFGNVTGRYNVIAGTLALDRHHAVAGAAVAPAPTGQSGGITGSVQVLVEGPVYDAFGNATFTRGPSGRCGNRDYDTDYKHLPVVSRIAGGPVDTATACGANLFAHRVTFDRGTNQVTDSIDPRNQPTRFGFDGLGRLTSVTYADPAAPGQLATLPSLTVSYQPPVNPDTTPYSVTVFRNQDGANPNISSYIERQVVTDGLGRTMVSLAQADSTAGDLGDWIASGYATYDARGNVARTYDANFFTGTLAAAIAGPPAATPYASQQYDAFERTASSFGFDHVVTSMFAYHALSTDAYDAGDALPTIHQGTYATRVADGHGRTTQMITRIKVGSTLEARTALSAYLPTNELVSVTQRRAGSTDVVRTLQYDSIGRRVLNVEPNTTAGASLAWRYAFNDAGDLVGTSDARGCGANYFYDTAGRTIAEDRSPCLASQAAYTSPNLTTGDGTEVFYRYDAADPENNSVIDAGGSALGVDTTQLWGRQASVSSLGSKAVYRYDAQGRSTGVGVRVQKPGTAASTLATRYAPRWYVKTSSLDARHRVLSSTSGVTTPELRGSDGTSELRASYTKRGLVRQLTSSYGPLWASGAFHADGRPKSFTLGDAAATHRDITYDANLRAQTIQTFRAAAPLWSAPPAAYTPPGPTDDPTRQLMLDNSALSYDEVGNVVRIQDNRVAADWPATAKPVTRVFDYDDLYRLTRTAYTHAGGAVDTWKSAFAAEDQTATLKPQPSPHVSFSTRVTDQRNQYDWLGNITQTTDDKQAFWDRSTGDRTHGTATAGPNQITSASNRTLAPTSTTKGDLSAGYDLAGNLTGLVIRRDGPCLPSAASCWQRFGYEWDEVGQLSRAQRWDLTTAERTSNGQLAQAAPARAANADLRFAYNGMGGRVLKTATDAAANQSQTLYVFSTLEVRSTTFNTTSGEYVVDSSTATVRLDAGPVTARIMYSPLNLPAVSSSKQHVLLELASQVGSTSLLIDHATGELAEMATYTSYGALDSDYRPARWGSQREPYKFSGKEEDIEVGLTYFGARYYSPYLSTWISPDPVTIHDAESDINPYAYVYGSPVMFRDPDGRIAPLVALAIVVGVSIVIAAITNASMQYHQNGGSWAGFNWGAFGMSCAAGAAAGAVGGVVGMVVGPAVGGVFGATAGTVVGGAAGGVAGSAAGYAVGNITSEGWKGDGAGLRQAMLIGGISGLAGGAAYGSALGQGMSTGAASVYSGLASGVVGYGTAIAIGGQQASWQGFALSIGAGIAASVATTVGIQWAGSKAPPNGGTNPKAGPTSGGPSTAAPEQGPPVPEEPNQPIKPLGKGSTANDKDRWLPRNLREELAVQQAMQDPTAGEVIPIELVDGDQKRWTAADGWVKMQQTIDSGGREGPQSVHYNRNTRTGAVDDFKIVIRKVFVPAPDPKVPNFVPDGR